MCVHVLLANLGLVRVLIQTTIEIFLVLLMGTVSKFIRHCRPLQTLAGSRVPSVRMPTRPINELSAR